MNAGRLVILGATGDLTGRYLLRALAELIAAGCLPGAAALRDYPAGSEGPTLP